MAACTAIWGTSRRNQGGRRQLESPGVWVGIRVCVCCCCSAVHRHALLKEEALDIDSVIDKRNQTHVYEGRTR